VVATTNTLKISTPRFSQCQNDQQEDYHDTLGAPWSDMDLLGYTKDYPELLNDLNLPVGFHERDL
jgi:hypothetical protein